MPRFYETTLSITNLHNLSISTHVNRSRIYMMPSYSEGFGMAMVEAALGGKAIVCSDIPVFHEIFNENEVRFFTLDNTDSLQQAIHSAYINREKLGKAAYIKANNEFTAQKMAENHKKYYDNLLYNSNK